MSVPLQVILRLISIIRVSNLISQPVRFIKLLLIEVTFFNRCQYKLFDCYYAEICPFHIKLNWHYIVYLKSSNRCIKKWIRTNHHIKQCEWCAAKILKPKICIYECNNTKTTAMSRGKTPKTPWETALTEWKNVFGSKAKSYRYARYLFRDNQRSKVGAPSCYIRNFDSLSLGLNIIIQIVMWNKLATIIIIDHKSWNCIYINLKQLLVEV